MAEKGPIKKYELKGFGTRLNQFMHEEGLGQEELAVILGCSQTVISQTLNAKSQSLWVFLRIVQRPFSAIIFFPILF